MSVTGHVGVGAFRQPGVFTEHHEFVTDHREDAIGSLGSQNLVGQAAEKLEAFNAPLCRAAALPVYVVALSYSSA